MLTQLSIYLKNRPGQLARFATLLVENDIEIRAITVAENEEYGLILLLVDKPDKCIKLLEEKDHIYSITKVIAVKVLSDEGHTKGLLKISKVLGENNVNIEYMYSTLVKDESLLILRVNDNEMAMEVLKENNFLLEEREKI
ncbi:MAG: hypothetical protein BAJALOKI3v1_300006 [Promethearchaeota archaeon]|jgi:hypothetical protein|nr:MAG: hypothetical protein BAJALOKI3v1_300006 [Candidatus Lokiarchaeota archaeon]